MRVLLRILFALLLLVGVLLAVVYPWSASTIGGYELGRFPIHRDGGEWRRVETDLTATDAPVFLTVEMHVGREFQPQADRIVLTLTASTGGRTVLAETMNFAEAPPVKESPQAVPATYRDKPGRIETVESGAYVFVVAPSEIEGIAIERVELVLQAGAFELDPRAQPAGFVLMALGFIGLVLAMRRFTGTKPRNPNEQPPIKRWGRRDGS